MEDLVKYLQVQYILYRGESTRGPNFIGRKIDT